jgi:hypothetical protein
LTFGPWVLGVSRKIVRGQLSTNFQNCPTKISKKNMANFKIVRQYLKFFFILNCHLNSYCPLKMVRVFPGQRTIVSETAKTREKFIFYIAIKFNIKTLELCNFSSSIIKSNFGSGRGGGKIESLDSIFSMGQKSRL